MRPGETGSPAQSVYTNSTRKALLSQPLHGTFGVGGLLVVKRCDGCAHGVEVVQAAVVALSVDVNGPTQMFEEFYETYDVKEGDGMYLAPEARIALW